MKIFLLVTLYITLSSHCSLFGPDLQKPLDQVTESLDKAISDIGTQSSNWQMTLSWLENDLISQGQSTLANEVQSLMNRGIAATGAEMKCTVDFLATRMVEGLRAIRARVLNKPVPPVIPHFCSVDPGEIDLRVLPANRPALHVYGYNLREDAIRVEVVNQNGSRVIPPPGVFTVPTEYMAVFNSVNYPFGTTNVSVVFKLPNNETQSVSIVNPVTCGGVGQPCCNGTQCESGTGCLSGTCTTCPAPWTPPATNTRTLVDLPNEFDGNNCGGVNNDHQYGGPCSSGFHREQCNTSIVATNESSTYCRASWATSDPNDCKCIVRFHTPNNCFTGIRCRIHITETQNQPQRPPVPLGCR